MKKGILLTFFWLLSLTCYGNVNSEAKKYCFPEEIELNERAIYLHTQEGMVELDCLRVDQGGIYYQASNIRCPDCRRGKGVIKNDTNNICQTPNCPSYESQK